MEDLRTNCDFSGWATKNDVRCSDGRTIRRGAFKECNNKIVPLVWNHDHRDPFNVLGHALLEERPDGMYAYCKFNDTESGENAKKLVGHKDVCALSICANKLKQHGGDVVHGIIREVSLVLAGANPKAYIEQVMTHGEASDEEAIIYTGEDDLLLHSIEDTSEEDYDPFDDSVDEDPKDDVKEVIEHAGDKPDEKPKEDVKMDNEEKKQNPEAGGEETVADVFNTLNEKQKTVVYAMIGQALEEAGKKDEDDEMKHNVFDDDDELEQDSGMYLDHAAQTEILNYAKNTTGSLRVALADYLGDGEEGDTLQHGFEQIDQLFPEWHDLMTGAPEAIPENDEWVSKVLGKVSKSPKNRLRTRQADVKGITAGGYGVKGAFKKNTGKIKILKRTTTPTTIYIKDEMDRDDKLDITDFDVVAYQFGLMKNALEEEIATDILIGDGRDDEDEQKVDPQNVRPIWTDDEMYTIHVDVDLAAMEKTLQGTDTKVHFGPEYIMEEAVVTAILYAKEQYKGRGNLDFYCEPHLKNQMMLARDMNGRRIHETNAALISALDVAGMTTIEKLAGKIRVDEDGQRHQLLGILVNMADYTVGMVRGGEITKFSQFDIDFNKEKYLMETRLCGTLTRVKSAIVLEKKLG